MFRKPLWVALLLTTTTLASGALARMPKGPIPVTEDDVLFHIRKVLAKDKKDDRWERAPRLAKIIHEEAQRYNIDPLVLTIIVQAESTFREGQLEGKLGEVGLTQIWGAARKCDKTANLKTSRGQVRAGACWYAFALEKCKTELGALHAYQSGECSSKAYGPLYRYRLLRRARAHAWHRHKATEDLLNPPSRLPPSPAYAEREKAFAPVLDWKGQLTL